MSSALKGSKGEIDQANAQHVLMKHVPEDVKRQLLQEFTAQEEKNLLLWEQEAAEKQKELSSLSEKERQSQESRAQVIWDLEAKVLGQRVFRSLLGLDKCFQVWGPETGRQNCIAPFQKQIDFYIRSTAEALKHL